MSLNRIQLTRIERLTLGLITFTFLGLRALAYFRYRFDSDEPQHLHVAWGWTAGFVQYRDYFDNHAPLFHMATAPILALFGERADILLCMRAPMLLLWAAMLWQCWILGRRFWSAEIALASVVLLSILPSFFLKSLEYRTDNAWNTLSVLVLVILTGGLPDRSARQPRTGAGRMFATGIVTGIALCVSMKTPLIAASLVIAWAATAFAFRERVSGRRAITNALAFGAGTAIVPALVSAFFISRGAWSQLVYCVLTFNELVEATHHQSLLLPYLYPLELAVLFVVARRVARTLTADDRTRTRFFLALFSLAFLLTLGSFWILISPRDMLPLMPLAALFLAAGIARSIASPGLRSASWACLALISVAMLIHDTDDFRDGTTEHITMMRQVLALSRPGEPLMDLKGETIYRRRPFYYIFERITREAMKQGLIRDTIAEDVVRSGCHVAQADGPFLPPRARAFLSHNFIDMGRLRAAGQWLAPDGSFSIAIPGTYVIVSQRGVMHGLLDGSAMDQPRALTAGPHRFVTESKERAACLWAPALARGFSPFHLKDLDF